MFIGYNKNIFSIKIETFWHFKRSLLHLFARLIEQTTFYSSFKIEFFCFQFLRYQTHIFIFFSIKWNSHDLWISLMYKLWFENEINFLLQSGIFLTAILNTTCKKHAKHFTAFEDDFINIYATKELNHICSKNLFPFALYLNQ